MKDYQWTVVVHTVMCALIDYIVNGCRFVSFHLVSFQCVHLPYDEEPMNDGVIGNDVCACPNMNTMNGTRSVSLRSRQLLLRDSLAPKQVEDRDNG